MKREKAKIDNSLHPVRVSCAATTAEKTNSGQRHGIRSPVLRMQGTCRIRLVLTAVHCATVVASNLRLPSNANVPTCRVNATMHTPGTIEIIIAQDLSEREIARIPSCPFGRRIDVQPHALGNKIKVCSGHVHERACGGGRVQSTGTSKQSVAGCGSEKNC